MSEKNTTRREAVRRLFVFSSAVVAAPLLASACKKEEKALSCTDTAGLTPDELKTRNEILAYVDAAPDPAKKCSGCALYKPAPADDQCGACQVVKGPINPNGWCKSWAAKPA